MTDLRWKEPAGMEELRRLYRYPTRRQAIWDKVGKPLLLCLALSAVLLIPAAVKYLRFDRPMGTSVMSVLLGVMPVLAGMTIGVCFLGDRFLDALRREVCLTEQSVVLSHLLGGRVVRYERVRECEFRCYFGRNEPVYLILLSLNGRRRRVVIGVDKSIDIKAVQGILAEHGVQAMIMRAN